MERLVLIAPASGTKSILGLHLATLPGIGEFLFRPPVTREAIRDAFRILTYKPFDYDAQCLEWYYEFQHYPGYTHAVLSYVRSVINLFGLTRKGKLYTAWFERELPKLTQPVLLVWGKQDRVIPCGNAAQLKSLLPKALLWEIDECGHCPLFEYAEEFNKRVMEFLERSGCG